jgi:NAD(P)-dependent dehydrogenase (short-subunit alcohol dehydrogenase family)
LRLVLINPKIASLVSFQGGLNVPAYAAKGGVAQLTKALSNSWAAHGINVNAVSRPVAEQYGNGLISITDCSGIYPY